MSSIGERIKFFRNYRNMTQKELGVKAGFPSKSADVRIAQYESGKRIPKGNIIPAIAYALKVSELALTSPDTSSGYGLMHTLFELEDKYGFRVTKIDGRICLKVAATSDYSNRINNDLESWFKEYTKLKDDDITVEDYNEWRYRFPEIRVERTKKALDDMRNYEKDNSLE